MCVNTTKLYTKDKHILQSCSKCVIFAKSQWVSLQKAWHGINTWQTGIKFRQQVMSTNKTIFLLTGPAEGPLEGEDCHLLLKIFDFEGVG